MQIRLGLLFLGFFSVTLESDIFIQSMLHPLTTSSLGGDHHGSACVSICNTVDLEISWSWVSELLTAIKTQIGFDSLKTTYLCRASVQDLNRYGRSQRDRRSW